jgi:hypothetical protein
MSHFEPEDNYPVVVRTVDAIECIATIEICYWGFLLGAIKAARCNPVNFNFSSSPGHTFNPLTLKQWRASPTFIIPL